MATVTGAAWIFSSVWLWPGLLADPFQTFLFIVVVTVFFYGAVVWSIAALAEERRFSPTGWLGFATAEIILFAVPLVLRYTLPV